MMKTNSCQEHHRCFCVHDRGFILKNAVFSQSLCKKLIVALTALILASCGGGKLEFGSSDNKDKTLPQLSLTVTLLTSIRVRLQWSYYSSADHYKVFVNSNYYKSVTSTIIEIDSLSPGVEQCFSVGAYNSSGQNVAASSQSCILMPPNNPPSQPQNLSTVTLSPGSIELSWDVSNDEFVSPSYRIYRNGFLVTTVAEASYIDPDLDPLTEYCYYVIAVDEINNESPASATSCASTPDDVESPTAPQSNNPDSVTSNQISLSWQPSTDNGTVRGYRIYRNDLLIADIKTTSYNDAGLSPETNYCYVVIAYDAAGNISQNSNTACSITSWKFISLGYAGYSRIPVSMDVDNNAQPVVAFQSDTYDINTAKHIYELRYIYHTGSTFNNITIQQTGGLPDISVVLNSRQQTHIVYKVASRLSYAVYDADIGSVELLTAGGTTVNMPDIVLDSLDNTHICYGSSNGIVYLNNLTGSWNEENVGSSYSWGCANVVDNNNNIHIIYMVSGSLKYAYKDISGWTITTLVSQNASEPDMAIDSNNKVHISYLDNNTLDLKYLTNASGSWVDTVLDSVGDVGVASAIAVDGNNKVHISHIDITNRHLKYSTDVSGSWQQNILHAGKLSANPETAIAIDTNNKIHISYIYGYELYYATNK